MSYHSYLVIISRPTPIIHAYDTQLQVAWKMEFATGRDCTNTSVGQIIRRVGSIEEF